MTNLLLVRSSSVLFSSLSPSSLVVSTGRRRAQWHRKIPNQRLSSSSARSRCTLTTTSTNTTRRSHTTRTDANGATSSALKPLSVLALTSMSLVSGFLLGRYTTSANDARPSELPNGLPRTCCDDEDQHLTDLQRALPDKLAKVVGASNVLDGRQNDTRTLPFLKGARLGAGGQALAIITPTLLEDVVKCVQLIVDADCVIIPQGQNTGLTGGSVPRPKNSSSDPRPVVIISMKHLDTIFPIDQGKRVVCLAGAGLATLQRSITAWFPDRESHSILGSTFLNPTVAAGVAFGSGGTQIRKGPAYTDRALYVRIDKNKFGQNVVSVVNTLGVSGLEDQDWDEYMSNPASIGQNGVVQQLDHYQRDVKQGFVRAMASSSKSVNGKAKASDTTYASRLCESSSQPNRFNADCTGIDCNRSEGKVLILASVHDTFPKPSAQKHFWLSFADLETALAFRAQVALHSPDDLPISMEYLDRDSFDVIDRSGRVLATLIKIFGPFSAIVSHLWSFKLWVEALPFAGAPLWVDSVLHGTNNLFPATLPKRLMEAGKEMDHHVALQIGEFGSGNMSRFLDRMQAFTRLHGQSKVVVHECLQSEAACLTAFRFVAAPAFRTWCVGEGVQGFSVDYALPNNYAGSAPPLSQRPLRRMRYSHFGCNVVHEDLAFSRGIDTHEAKMALKGSVERNCNGRLPAEHGHGTEYHAPPETRERWSGMDPLNVMNPGIGGLPVGHRYKDSPEFETASKC